MIDTTKGKSTLGNDKADVTEAAKALLHESKKLAHEWYEEGLHKVEDAQTHAKVHSDELVKKVSENPVSSILIAAGVGFLLSSLLKK